MADQQGKVRRDTENDPSGMEKAEGLRENVNLDDQQDRHQASGHQSAGGITNRPLDEEEAEQAEVPPRGLRKDEVNDEK